MIYILSLKEITLKFLFEIFPMSFENFIFPENIQLHCLKASFSIFQLVLTAFRYQRMILRQSEKHFPFIKYIGKDHFKHLDC